MTEPLAELSEGQLGSKNTALDPIALAGLQGDRRGIPGQARDDKE